MLGAVVTRNSLFPTQPIDEHKTLAPRSFFRPVSAAFRGDCRKCQTATAAPAKPGALGFEPLKAAGGRSRGPVPHSESPAAKE